VLNSDNTAKLLFDDRKTVEEQHNNQMATFAEDYHPSARSSGIKKEPQEKYNYLDYAQIYSESWHLPKRALYGGELLTI